MVNWKARLFLFCIAVSATSAGIAVVSGSLLPEDAVTRRDEFQTLVGGLGFGSAVDLSQCSFSFDPRLGRACSHLDGPIPGGFFLCPQHVGCAAGYPHLLPTSHVEAEVSGDAASH